MRIVKQGSRRSSQSHHLVPDRAPRVSWNKNSKTIELSASNIPDGHGSKWDYWVNLSIADLRNTLACLAEEGIQDCQDDFQRVLIPFGQAAQTHDVLCWNSFDRNR